MNDIQKARDVLARWRAEAQIGQWNLDGPDYQFFGQRDGDYVNADIISAGDNRVAVAAMHTPLTANQPSCLAASDQFHADARLIVGTAGNPELLDAIDGQLAYAINLESTGWDGPGIRQIMREAKRMARTIVAADERMK